MTQVVQRVNRWAASLKLEVRLDLFGWETARPGLHAQGPQARIEADLQIDRSDLVVGIFWKRFGTPVMDARSGTEREIRLAYATWLKEHKPDIWLYFRMCPVEFASQSELDQYKQVLAFKEEYRGKALIKEYHDLREFESMLFLELTRYVVEAVSVDNASRTHEKGVLVCEAGCQPTLVASEGLTEPLGDIALTFSSSGVQRGLVRLTIHVFLNTSITNRLVGPNLTDAVVVSATGTGERTWKGQYHGNSLSFENIEFEWPSADRVRTLRIANIRANASAVAPGGFGAPGQIVPLIALGSENAVIVGPAQPAAAALVQGALSFSIRDADNLRTLDTPVRLRASAKVTRKCIATLRYAAKFKGAFAPRDEAVRLVRVKALFLDVPVGMTLWVATENVSTGAVAKLTSSEVGPSQPVSSAENVASTPIAQLAVVSGRAAAIWEIQTTSDNAPEQFDFAVFVDHDGTSDAVDYPITVNVAGPPLPP